MISHGTRIFYQPNKFQCNRSRFMCFFLSYTWWTGLIFISLCFIWWLFTCINSTSLTFAFMFVIQMSQWTESGRQTSTGICRGLESPFHCGSPVCDRTGNIYVIEFRRRCFFYGSPDILGVKFFVLWDERYCICYWDHKYFNIMDFFFWPP